MVRGNKESLNDGIESSIFYPSFLPDPCISEIVSVTISASLLHVMGMACGNIIHSFAIGVPFNDSNNWGDACLQPLSFTFQFKREVSSSLLPTQMNFHILSKAFKCRLSNKWDFSVKVGSCVVIITAAAHPLMKRKISIRPKCALTHNIKKEK